MLSEIFILRLEAILRSPIAPGTGNSDTRFVPIERTVGPAKVMQQGVKYARPEGEARRPFWHA
jgi:hypothetical protein